MITSFVGGSDEIMRKRCVVEYYANHCPQTDVCRTNANVDKEEVRENRRRRQYMESWLKLKPK